MCSKRMNDLLMKYSRFYVNKTLFKKEKIFNNLGTGFLQHDLILNLVLSYKIIFK